jgi:hypothetical protein
MGLPQMSTIGPTSTDQRPPRYKQHGSYGNNNHNNPMGSSRARKLIKEKQQPEGSQSPRAMSSSGARKPPVKQPGRGPGGLPTLRGKFGQTM